MSGRNIGTEAKQGTAHVTHTLLHEVLKTSVECHISVTIPLDDRTRHTPFYGLTGLRSEPVLNTVTL